MSINISYKPTDGLTYDPSDAKYWDPDALQDEITRVFEVCHGCRMCFKYCDSFPILFKAVDDDCDGDVTRLTAEHTEAVVDSCFQCKLCEVQCPYTPADDHEFQLDFPKLVHRYVAQRTRREGLNMGQRLLSDPDRSAKYARASLGLANVMNRVTLHRWFLEKLLGVHREKLLPEFASTTFEKWAKGNDKIAKPGAGGRGGEAILFQTCFVQNNDPQIGRDAVDVLEKNQVDVGCVEGLMCCGMPRWEKGDIDGLRRQAKHNLDVLLPHVTAGAKILGLNPTCTMMMRREYPELLEGPDRARAKTLAEAVMDASEFLWSIRREDRFNTDFKSTPGAKVSYHAPCHLRAQRVGFKGRDLIKKIPGTKLGTVMECCGHDGTYAMSVDGFEPSIRVGKKAFDGMQEVEEAEIWATDCPLAAIQFEQHAGRKPMHPMTILAKAYRADGFSTALVVQSEDD